MIRLNLLMIRVYALRLASLPIMMYILNKVSIMNPKQILLVDDEPAITQGIAYYLEREGYAVQTAETGQAALAAIGRTPFDLIVLDLMLPDISGLEITRLLKQNLQTAEIPIVMLTAKSEDMDIVIGMELDAEDYITKPFSARVLVARINAIIRRRAQNPALPETSPGEEAVLQAGALTIHLQQYMVFANGQRINLTKTEFDLLLLLVQRKGWVYSRMQIVDALKGADYAVTDRSVDAQVRNLRKKLGEYCEYIETVRGVGYKFTEAAL